MRRAQQCYELRWHIASRLIGLAIKIAPRGPARSSLVNWLNAWGRHVMDTVAANREAE